MTTSQLKLFVSGNSANSQLAILNLKKLCEHELDEPCDVIIVDVLESPDVAETEKIIATPTLVRLWPLPARRIVGDLSDLRKVKAILGLQ